MANPGKGFSGIGGTAKFGDSADSPTFGTEVSEVTKWTLDQTAAVAKYNSNKTGGHKKGVAGVRDTKGTVEIKVSSTDGQQLKAGDVIALELDIMDNSLAIPASIGSFQISEAIITGTPSECDVDEGSVVGMTYSFEASDCTGTGVFA